MARLHVGKRVVISIDLKDFFHSIKQERINTILLQLGIGEHPARTLSELCTYKFFMPQGALTSPKLANIITATSFGPLVKEYCDQKGLTLSIYADDITMSTDQEDLNARQVLTDIMNIVRGVGFRINYDKTKVMYRTRRQYVCGVVVNAKTNMLKHERYKLRAIVHNIERNGVEAEAAKNSLTGEEFAHQIRGKVNWLRQLNPELGSKLYEKLAQCLKTEVETKKETTTDIANNIEKETVPIQTETDTSNTSNPSDSTIPW